eukprot:symbB.v1.2.004127.t1/scaffold232.1/size259024/4
MQRNPHSGQGNLPGCRRQTHRQIPLPNWGKLGTWVELSEIQHDGATGRNKQNTKQESSTIASSQFLPQIISTI